MLILIYHILGYAHLDTLGYVHHKLSYINTPSYHYELHTPSGNISMPHTPRYVRHEHAYSDTLSYHYELSYSLDNSLIPRYITCVIVRHRHHCVNDIEIA
jgi:hypothetical protein